MDLLREIIEYQEETINLAEAIEEAVKSLNLMKAGGKVMAKGAGQFFKANPGLVIGAAALALDARGKYKRNRRNTIRLHAKDPYERRMMTSIVDALTKGGKFKVKRAHFQGGGKTWVLIRQGSYA